MNFDNTNYKHKDEYLHIDQCTYTEYDGDDETMGDQIVLIEDGCDETLGLVSFKGSLFTFLISISNVKLRSNWFKEKSWAILPETIPIESNRQQRWSTQQVYCQLLFTSV